jgi:TetR/AcrR family transcriptional regulator
MSARAVTLPSGEISTRDAILDAAERLFAERGFTGVSTREIAADAGLRNQASLYHHFRDKEALYEAVLARGLTPIVALIGEAGERWQEAGAGLRRSVDAVDPMLDQLLDHLDRQPHLPRLIQRAGLDDSPYLRATFHRLLEPLAAQGMRVLAGSTVGPWEPADLPHLAAGLYLLLFGYFANAPLVEVLVEQDPHSPAAVARQRRFLKTAFAQLLGVARVRRVASRGRRRTT